MAASQTTLLHVLDPPRYVATFLGSAVRPDGRPLQACRKVALSGELVSVDESAVKEGLGQGSALARFGSTSAGAYVEAALARAAAGPGSSAAHVTVSVMLPPVASPVFRTYGDRTSVSRMGFDSSAPAPSSDSLASSVQQTLLATGLVPVLERLLKENVDKAAEAAAQQKAEANKTVVDSAAVKARTAALAAKKTEAEANAEAEAARAAALAAIALAEESEPVRAPPAMRLRLALDIAMTSFDGNAADACIMAATAALLQLRLRLPYVVGKAAAPASVRTFGSWLAERGRMGPCSLPVPLSFALVPGSASSVSAMATDGSAAAPSAAARASAGALLSLPDPTGLEEGVACGASTVVVGLPLALVAASAAAAGAAAADASVAVASLPVLTFSQRFAAGAVSAHATGSTVAADEPTLLLARQRALDLQPLLAALLA